MRRFILTAAITAAVVLVPAAALAQATTAAGSAIPYLAIASIVVAFISELMPFLPIKDNGIIQAILHFLNQFFAKKPR